MNDFPLRSQVILTADQLAAIGSVAIESTYCENAVEIVVWLLSGLDESHGKHFTHNVQLNSRLDLLGTLAKLHLKGDSVKQEFTRLVSDMKEANTRRNTIIHGSWSSTTSDYLALFADGPNSHTSAVATKRRLNSEPITFSAENILQVAHEIAGLRKRLHSLVDRAWPDASLGTSPSLAEGR